MEKNERPQTKEDAIKDITSRPDCQIELTFGVLSLMFPKFERRMRENRICLVYQADYGYFRYTDEWHKERDICLPGEYIVIEGDSVLFMSREVMEKYEYQIPQDPDLNKVILY